MQQGEASKTGPSRTWKLGDEVVWALVSMTFSPDRTISYLEMAWAAFYHSRETRLPLFPHRSFGTSHRGRGLDQPDDSHERKKWHACPGSLPSVKPNLCKPNLDQLNPLALIDYPALAGRGLPPSNLCLSSERGM